jgi:uncharacterized protein YtpQ (UPF0354 family)
MNRSTQTTIVGVCTVLSFLASANAQQPRKAPDDEPRVFPLLKAYGYPHKELCVFQNYNGIDKSPVPLVAFCHDTPDGYQLITKQAAEKNGWTVESLREQAQKNIDAYPCRWERYRGFLLTASGKDFSAEKLLCKDFLLEAHKLLRAKKILIAAPRRTVLYAASNDLQGDSLELFKTIVAETLADDSFGNPKISPLIFRFEDGEPAGALIIKQAPQR